MSATDRLVPAAHRDRLGQYRPDQYRHHHPVMTQIHSSSARSTDASPTSRPDSHPDSHPADHRGSRSNHPTLRLAGPTDADFLYELFVATRGPAFASLPEHLVGPLFEQQYRAQQASYAAMYPTADHHVVELAGEPIGQIRVDRAATSIVLADISLLPMCRGYGVGTHLIGSLIDESEYTGMPIELSVTVPQASTGPSPICVSWSSICFS